MHVLQVLLVCLCNPLRKGYKLAALLSTAAHFALDFGTTLWVSICLKP